MGNEPKWVSEPIPLFRWPARDPNQIKSRSIVASGRDPKAERDKQAEPTFGTCADEYIASIKAEWRNAKHAYQWDQTLTNFCKVIRPKRESEINTADVLNVLTPIWQTHNETASRLRGRIQREYSILRRSKVARVGEIRQRGGAIYETSYEASTLAASSSTCDAVRRGSDLLTNLLFDID